MRSMAEMKKKLSEIKGDIRKKGKSYTAIKKWQKMGSRQVADPPHLHQVVGKKRYILYSLLNLKRKLVLS